jgi:hypothetical protein
VDRGAVSFDRRGAPRGRSPDGRDPRDVRRTDPEHQRPSGLSPEQKKAAEELLVGYETEFHAAVRRMEDIQKAVTQEFSQSGDFKTIQEIMPDVMK